MTAAGDPLARCRVLLVEDDYFIASEMSGAFAARGAEVLGPVPTVAAALALIAATPEIDAAILDINLQGEMSYPVADALQARSVPFLFATGYDRAALPPRFTGVRHCEKPVDPATIAAALFA